MQFHIPDILMSTVAAERVEIITHIMRRLCLKAVKVFTDRTESANAVVRNWILSFEP